MKDKRLSCAKSVIEFAFNKKRARVLSSQKDCRDEAAGVLYWMSRDQRIQGRFFCTCAVNYDLPFCMLSFVYM